MVSLVFFFLFRTQVTFAAIDTDHVQLIGTIGNFSPSYIELHTKSETLIIPQSFLPEHFRKIYGRQVIIDIAPFKLKFIKKKQARRK